MNAEEEEEEMQEIYLWQPKIQWKKNTQDYFRFF